MSETKWHFPGTQPIAVLLPYGVNSQDWSYPGERTRYLEVKQCGGLAQPFLLFANGITRPMEKADVLARIEPSRKLK